LFAAYNLHDLRSSTREVFVRVPLCRDVPVEAVIYNHHDHFFLRPAGSKQEILVAALDGSAGTGRSNVTVFVPPNIDALESHDHEALWRKYWD
jgi:hypothetical protein